MDKPYLAERAFRLCRRCGRYRSVGNFSVSRTRRGRISLATVCHLCWRPGSSHARRTNFVLTDMGRAALAEMAKAS
jgi:hypothetical protein